MSSNTSVGRGPASGGNENHSGDPRSKTLGEDVKQEPPAGSGVLTPAAPQPLQQDEPDGAGRPAQG